MTYTTYTQGYASDRWTVDVHITVDNEAGATLVQDLSTATDEVNLLAGKNIVAIPVPIGPQPDPTGKPVAYAVRLVTNPGLKSTDPDYVKFAALADAQNAVKNILKPNAVDGEPLYTAQDGNPSTGPWNVRVVTIDPTSPYALRVTHGQDIATPEPLRKQVALSGALLGVNGSDATPGVAVGPPPVPPNLPKTANGVPVLEGYTGVPEGLDVEGGVTMNAANDHRTALLLNGANGPAQITEVSTTYTLSSSDKSSTTVNGIDRLAGNVYGCGQPGAIIDDSRLNPTQAAQDPIQAVHHGQCHNPNDLVLFRPEWGSATPKVVGADPGYEVVLNNNWVVTGSRVAGGPIAPGQRVLQGIGTGADWLRQHAPVGATLIATGSLTDDGGKSVAAPALDAIAGGGPGLVRGGNIDVSMVKNGFPAHSNVDVERQPRTVVGIGAAGQIELVTIDGRNPYPGGSVGVTMGEAAAVMKWLGATDAVEMGYGGDTAMIINDSLYNTPMNFWGAPVGPGIPNYERALGNALVLVHKPGP
ncbi:phosphodiester glycosidase family protein [Streptomyces tateyamensis]|uniref:phosphodiester glycosidase family protein n=1 Tax=Streptomyces tateyamensis TaxID=565073 RepID=UPI0015E8A3B9|nr:phosphodiester glycosidase family protein [Streptomyces tateyamensis]